MDLGPLTLDLTVVGRVLAAAMLALPIGLEREIKGKPAGLRTHLLLAASAAALGWASIAAAEGDSSADPTRIASYTIAGISFLGGGLIVGVHSRLHGLTTAVGAFTTTVIGLLAGMGFLLAGTALAILTLLTLSPVAWVKRHLFARQVRSESTLHSVLDAPLDLGPIMACVGPDVELRAFTATPVGVDQTLVQLTLRGRPEAIQSAIATLEAGDRAGSVLVAGAEGD